MLNGNSFAVVLLGGALMSAPAFSQEESPLYRSEATVQGVGSFVKDTTERGVRQSATKSGGVLADYRFYFTRNHGVEVNYGFTQNTQSYHSSADVVGLKARSHEVSAAYVYRLPLKRLTPFALAGVGALVFDPKQANGAYTQARAAFVYGGGADINISKRAFLRVQYRGLVYNSPTFGIGGLNGLDRVTHRAEPSAGFGFRF